MIVFVVYQLYYFSQTPITFLSTYGDIDSITFAKFAG